MHVVSASGDHDDKWPGWARLLILIGAPLVLWGAVALVWAFLLP